MPPRISKKSLKARPSTHEPEITAPVKLCTHKGLLRRAGVGWSRRPLHTCNTRGHWLRKKKWNYWAVTSDRYLFSATVANLDYIGIVFVYFLDFETKRFIEKTVTTPLGRGCRMPEVVEAPIDFRHKRLDVLLDDRSSSVRIAVNASDFGGAPLASDIAVTRPAGHETLNVVIPWSRDRFQFTSKQNTLPASGTVRIGGDEYVFEEGKSFAVLDYGRGVWKYDCFWNWGAASGIQDGRFVGLNLGGSWTDGTGMTENGVCLDGHLTKIGHELEFTCDKKDYMRPWTVRSRESDAVDLELVPFYERVAKTDLVIMRSEVHQVFGRYSGSVVAEGGEKIAIDGLVGWVEQHQARW
ncbi:MAG TPA: DUF2804 domain-containing protein [Dehalococcoidia bacterium]|nr:DUF2804 domain-containing protein [Dehalococcoidia bacterium]